MSNVFFPANLSPQGFLNDIIAAQLRSPKDRPFPDLYKFIHEYDYIKRVGNRLFFLHPNDDKKLLTQIEPQTLKESSFSEREDEYKKRRYVNFLNDMTPVQQAALVPYIRLYTKEFKGDNQFIRSKEIVFNREYRIPNAPQGGFAGGGRGNAGIESLQVERDFQYFNMPNRFTVQINYLFDSFDTFANGMQYENIAGIGLASSQADNFSLFGQDQGSGYISLIKKGSEIIDGGVIREYLFLEYGYRFPDTLSEEIVSLEDRKIFEAEEKKEIRIACYKHDFTFSETGEVKLSVSYNASTDIAMASRTDEKTNDVFLIANKGVISEMMDEPSENENGKKNSRSELFSAIEQKLNLLKEQNEKRRRLSLTYCPEDVDKEQISKIDDDIKEINKNIYALKKELLKYMYLFFLRYFMTTNSLFNIKLKPIPYELEKSVLNPCDVVINRGKYVQETILSIERVNKNPEVNKKEFTIRTDYLEKIREIFEKDSDKNRGIISTTYFSDPLVENLILKNRFDQYTSPDGIAIPSATQILINDLELESYSCYQALQTFTLSRMTAQAHLVRAGVKAKECQDIDTTEYKQIADTSLYSETYGNISFFPLKALLAAVINFTLDTAEDQNNFPIICLGSVLTESMNKQYFTNIGDLLVDVDFFKEWLYKCFINREKLDPTIDDFMNEIFEKLVPSILSAAVGHYTKGNHGYITKKVYELSEDAYKDEQLLKDLASEDPQKRDEALKKLMKDALSPTKKEQVKRPLILYYQQSFGRPDDVKQSKALFLKNYGRMRFDKKEDYNLGIYHVLMGQNSGIVKNINFSYMADPNLNTLYAMKNPNHLSSYMKYSYEANIDFVGNGLYFDKVNFFAIPNNQFNVSNTGISYSTGKDVFGLSGYYQVSKTTDKISLGEYTTTVTARNMYAPGVEDLKTRKCKQAKEITGSGGGGGGGKSNTEPPIPNYVKLDIGEYIYEAFRDSSEIASYYNVFYSKDLQQDKERKAKEDEERRQAENNEDYIKKSKDYGLLEGLSGGNQIVEETSEEE